MRAIVFAAGKGTRLGAITQSVPKALVEVAGRPMLGRVLDRVMPLATDGVTVNIHWLAPQVSAYLAGHYPAVEVQDESALLLDTGGALARWRREHPDCREPLLVHNCDVLTDIPLAAMAEAHRLTGADVTLCVHARPTSRPLLFDAAGRLLRRAVPGEEPAPGQKALAFDGIHILSPRALDRLSRWRPAETPFSVTDFYIDSAARARDGGVDRPFADKDGGFLDGIDDCALDIRCWTPGAGTFHWFDIGRPDTLAKAAAHLRP